MKLASHRQAWAATQASLNPLALPSHFAAAGRGFLWEGALARDDAGTSACPDSRPMKLASHRQAWAATQASLNPLALPSHFAAAGRGFLWEGALARDDAGTSACPNSRPMKLASHRQV